MVDAAGVEPASENTSPRDSYTYPLNLKGDGSPAGMPAWWRSKWRSDGVMVSWRAWSGVRDASPLPASR